MSPSRREHRFPEPNTLDRDHFAGGMTDHDGAHRVPAIVSVGSVVAVLAVNLAILVYAVKISLPGEGRAAAGELLAVVPPLDDAVDLDEAWDDDEWVYEELPVVNPFELPDPRETRTVFLRQCAICHGAEGRGDGTAADLLLPRPRDFVGSPFRYASPGADREHVIAGLERTIAQGVPRSAMPGFQGVLTEAQRAGLARYVLALRTDEPPANGVADVGVRPPLTPGLVARGRELYATLSCNTCHGDSGRGDGINSRSLVDSQDKPVRPADFTLGLFKTGQAPEDLCRTILRGIPGTPMLAYESILAVENPDEESLNVMDAWALVAYIRSFSPTPAHIGASSGAELIAQPAPAESMISDPSHVAWLGVPSTRITIKPLSAREDHTTCLEVRVVRTRERIALALDWNDDTIDLSRSAGLYPDAVAVMFGLGDDVPPLPMCRELKGVPSGRPAYFWHWKADRQYDAATGRRHLEIALDDSQPNDWYLFVPGPHARLPLLST